MQTTTKLRLYCDDHAGIQFSLSSRGNHERVQFLLVDTCQHGNIEQASKYFGKEQNYRKKTRYFKWTVISVLLTPKVDEWAKYLHINVST